MKIAPEEKNYKDLVDVVSSSLIYLGKAEPGTTTNDNFWQIFRKQKTGTVWFTEMADGNEKFDNVWDNRASLSYS